VPCTVCRVMQGKRQGHATLTDLVVAVFASSTASGSDVATQDSLPLLYGAILCYEAWADILQQSLTF
jgi:hypothetical protein